MKIKLYICEYQYKKETYRADERRVRDFLFETVCKRNSIKNPEIIKGEHGKPYIKGNPFYYSISHCKGLVIMAVSDNEVGVDCELIREHNLRALERVASEKERLKIEYSEDRMVEFFRLWTMKESYVKLIGTGIGYPLKNIDTTGDCLVVDGAKKLYPCYFIYNEFAISVIDEGKKIPEVEMIILEENSDRKT
jgi:phosphopantetheinyl transferase